MSYLFLGLIIIALILLTFEWIKNLIYSILTLSFLPHALGMFDGNVGSYSIPIIGQFIEVLINYFVAAFINLIDFFIWFINWIPGVNWIINFIYRSPDMVERYLPDIFGGLAGHRNFITHSILNPVFLVYLIICLIIIILVHKTSISDLIKIILFFIGLTFVCHLLADTMPKSWRGTAHIKLFLFTKFYTLPAFLSKLWLYMNAVLSFYALTYVTQISNTDID